MSCSGACRLKSPRWHDRAIRTWPAFIGCGVGATCKAAIDLGPWLCLQKLDLLAVARG